MASSVQKTVKPATGTNAGIPRKNAIMETQTQTQETVKAVVIRQEVIEGLDCVIVSESFNFRSVDADKKIAGVEYEEIKDEEAGTVKYKRKTATVELAYPLLANFGIVGEFDPVTAKYADKVHQYVFGTIAADVYKFAQSKVSANEGFTLAELSIKALAEMEPAKRGGRKAEVDQALLDAAVLDFGKWLKAQGRPAQVIGIQVTAIKKRLAGAAGLGAAKLAKMGENWALWYEQLSETDVEKFADVFDFIVGKFNSIDEISEADF